MLCLHPRTGRFHDDPDDDDCDDDFAKPNLMILMIIMTMCIIIKVATGLYKGCKDACFQ